MPGISAVSPPTRGAARLTAAFGHARHYRLHHFRTVLADRHILIKEEKRLGALGKDIVDAHGHRVYAYRVVLVEKKGDFLSFVPTPSVPLTSTG